MQTHMPVTRPILVLPGGNGFLGRSLAARFVRDGWRVRVLSRQATPERGGPERGGPERGGVETLVWDGRTLGGWAAAIDGATAVLNLAGRSVNCRYGRRNREEIERSRVESTRVLGQAIAAASQPPRVWLNSSTATMYRHAEDRPQDEFDGEIGVGFSVNVARAWEAAFFEATVPAQTRRVALRTAMVMGRGRGGPFNVFHNLVRLRLGGTMGPGTQRVSWIHIDDLYRAIRFLIDLETLDGAVNLVAPTIPTNGDFMREIRKAAGIRIGLPAYRPMLEIGALVLRTETELPLKSRWVAPTKLLRAGFVFEFADWKRAALDLVRGSAIADRPS